MDEQKQTQLEIDLSHEVAQGTYANLTIIAHSTSEFIIDFIRLMPGVTKPEVKSRIILTPENAKRLMLALQDNIWKYEQDNGTIRLASENQQPTGFPIDLEPKGQALITAGIFSFCPGIGTESLFINSISALSPEFQHRARHPVTPKEYPFRPVHPCGSHLHWPYRTAIPIGSLGTCG